MGSCTKVFGPARERRVQAMNEIHRRSTRMNTIPITKSQKLKKNKNKNKNKIK